MSNSGTWCYWGWSEDWTCSWARWACDEMCPWSEWKPCDPKVYRMCSFRKNWFYYFCFPWSSCYPFNAPLWVSCYTGDNLFSAFGTCFFVLLLSNVYIELDIVESPGALYRWIAESVYCGWDIGVRLYACSRPIWQLCYPGWLSLFHRSLSYLTRWKGILNWFCY